MEKKLYALTNPQKSIYLTEEYYKGTNINNIAGTITIEQPVQFEKLTLAIKQLIKQNDGCRIMLSNEEQEVKQWIAPYQDFQIEIIDVASENELSEIAKKVTSKPFSLYNSYLFKFVLYRFPDNHGGFIINMHHLIADSWSMGIAINEIMEIYSSYLKGEEHQEKDTTLYSYTNYITAEQEYKKSDKYQKDKAYWEEVFSTIPESATIPSIQTNATSNNFSKALREQLSIPSNLLNRIKEYCSSQKVSVYNFLTAIFSIYISRVSNLEDICIGTPILNRANFKEKNTTGMFINTLPIRVKMDTSMSFSEFLNSVMANSMALLRHQKYSYQNIIEELRKKQSNLPALYQIMISYQITKINEEQEEIPHETKWIFNGITADDIDIHIFDLNDTNELNIAYDYKTEKYTSQEMKQIHERILSIISQVLNKEDIALSEIEIVTLEEKEKLIHGFNQTKMDYPKDKTIAQLFEEQVKLTPNNVALVFEDKSLTYQELNEKANQLAYYLMKKGIKRGEIVSLFLEKSIETIVGILAILKVGAAFLPLDVDYPKERIDYILENSNSKMILTNKNYLGKIEANTDIVDISMEENDIYGKGNTTLDSCVNGNPFDLAYIMYTSGSTGQPKGVMVCQRNIVRLVKNTNYIQFENNEHILQTGSIVFDACTFEIWGSLLNGHTLYLIPKEKLLDISYFTNYLRENKITILWLTASLTNYICEQSPTIFKNVRVLLTGGDVLSVKHIQKIQEANPNLTIVNGYGPTENTTFSTCYTIPRKLDRLAIPIGYPIANSTCYVVSKLGKLQPIGMPGELWVGGDGVSLGYLNREDLTKEKFIDNHFEEGKIYKTGDLTRILPDGRIEFLGRIDNQVKIRGFRVELSEIDSKLKEYPNINQTFTCIKKAENQTIIVSYITSKEKIDIKELKLFLKSSLPTYMIPTHIIALEKFPLNINGKIDRNALPEPSENITTEIVLPRNELDKIIIESLQELLHQKEISIEDSFFDLGGDSLSAINLCTILYNKISTEISVKDILTYPIIKDLSDFISTKGTKKSVSFIEAVEKREYYPVSSAQKRMYYASSLDDNSLVYNIAGGVILDKTLNKEKLEKCFNTIINRHESLRTYFEIVEGNIVQKILDKVDFKLDFENINTNDIDKLFNDFVKPFNLNKAPLFNAKLININNEKSFLLLNMHHIISDGTSLSIFIDELCKLYNSEDNLPELTISYKDFAVWENNKINSDEFNKDKEFWVNQFNDEIPLLNMPTNYTRPSVQSFEGDNVFSQIDSNLTSKINEISKQLGITPYMLLLSVYYILLYKYTGQNDIVVGSPIVGRDNVQLSNIIGMFVNSLALRNKIDSSMSFKEFATEIKNNCLNAFEHQTYPLDELVSALEIKRDTSRNPLFDTMFIYQNNGNVNPSFDGVKSEVYTPKTNIAKFDLSLEIIPENNGLNLHFEYCTKLFNKDFITRLSKHYLNILQTIIKENEIKIADIDMLSKEEKEQILNDFNNTKVDYPKDKTVIELFEEQVEKNPNGIAVIFEEQKLTYKELNEKANQMAHCLIENGVKNNDIVGIMLNRSFETIISMLAVLKADAAYMLIDVNLPEDRIVYMLKNANSTLLITASDIKNIDFDKKLIIDKVNTDTYQKNNLKLNYNIKDNLSIVYTSGSTGNPKGVLLIQQGMINLIFCYKKFIDIDNFNKFLSICSISFDMFAVEIFIPLLNNKTLILANEEEHKDPIAISKLIKTNRVEFMLITPSKIQLLLENNSTSDCLQNLKSIQLGGEIFIANLFETLKKYTNAQICNEYGPSEITSCCSYKEIISANDINIGGPIHNVQIYILNQDMNLCPIGVDGEICVSGDGISKGYINNSTATEKVFVKNPYGEGLLYKTGDIGKYNASGEIEYIGRKDFQVKLRGLRIELSEIEKQLLNIENIKNCAVIYKEQPNNNSYLAAFFTSTKDIDISFIRTELSKHLPLYMVPKYIIELDNMPITRNGKIDLKTLKEYKIENVETSNYVAPENEIQQLFCDTWEKLLNTKVGITDNIFELGADSLLAIKFKVEMLSHNIDVQYSDIFKYPTIKEFYNNIIDTVSNQNNANIIPKAEKQEYYPVSSAQKRIYYASSLDGDNSLVYNIAGGVILDKTLNKEKLEKCFNTIINRHESLRTYFEIVEGNIVQKILDKIDFKLDFENVNTNDVDKLFNDFVKPFNLNKAPLFNAKLININNEKSFLLLNMHHIISDGTSFSVLIDELCKLYNNESNLPELTINYKDFAVWENKKINSEEFNKDKEFWVEQFNDEIPLLNMPTNYTRPSVQSFEGDNVFSQIDGNLTAKINEVSKQLGITPYMLLLSVYYILLYKYTGQNDIVVGSPIVGRDNVQLSNIIGMFVNSLALRNKIDSSMSFKDFATEIKNNCLNAFEHQTYPFDELISALEIKRDTSRNPLFDTMFVYQNNGNATMNFDGIKSEVYTPKSNVAKFDLSLEVMPENRGLTLRFEYCTKLFNKDFITRLSKHYLNILQTIIKENEIKIADIDMLSKEEKEQILNDFNNTKVDYPKDKTVIELFEEQAEKNPNGIAIIFEEQKLTYKELNEKANQMAHCLIENGVKNNDIISVCMNKNIPFIISVLGILKCGCAYLPINPTYPINRIEYIVTDSHSKIFITDTNYEIKGAKTLTYNTINLNKYEKNITPNKINNNDLAYVIYTSGSTGNPKGVMVTHKNLVNFLFSFNNCFKNKFSNKDNCLSLTNISFDVSVCEIFTPLAFGATLTLYPENTLTSISLLSDILTKNKVTFLYIPPSVLNDVADYIITNNIKVFVDKLLVGVEAIKNSTLNKFLEINKDMEIINGYGPTETTICTTFYLYKKSNNLNENVPIGYPISNSKIYILDKDNHIAPIEVIGELCVSGDNVSKGYLNNEELTNKSFIHNEKISKTTIYKTGDLAYWTQNGTLSFIGRNDSQIKFKGHRIELNEINSTLKNITNVTNSYTMIRKVNNIDSICSFITTSENVELEDIYSHLKKNLPYYMIPSHIIMLETFPLTLNGKIDKKVLQEYEIANTERLNYVAPENETQKLFCDTWEKLLNTKVGITDDIFELGADSLLAIKFKVEILSHNINIEYADIFKYPTVKELSEAKSITAAEQVDSYNYDEINKILEKNNIKNSKNMITNKTNNVLLLGSNGFVGMHILYNFIKKDNGKIYCIVRDKNKISARTRILDALHFYFNSELDEFIDNRIIILKGDITKENFGLNTDLYNDIVDNVSIVINSSANVRHYGNFKNFEDINIGLTQKAIEFCEKYNKRLIQISTTSVSGEVNKNENISFSENNLYIGQNLDNVYVKSKFEAERIILEHISKGLKAQILRLGNITNRYVDGKFQINPNENAFIGRIQSFIKLGIIPDYLLNAKLEFTPVDLCGLAIVTIMQNYVPDFSVFHIYNNNYITMKDFVEILRKYNVNLKVVNDKEFDKIIKDALLDESKKDILSGIVNELNSDNNFEIRANIDILSEFSRSFLYAIDFNWSKIDNSYIERYIKYFKDIKFI